MNTLEFLSYLDSLGVKLWIEDGTLRCSVPKSAATPALQKELAERKAAILAFFEGVESSAGSSEPPIRPAARDGALPLSFAQQRLWFLDRLMPGSTAYNIFNAVRLSGPLDLATFERCFSEVIRRHESLRTSFATLAEQPIQVIAPPWALRLPIVDLGQLAREEQKLQVRGLAAAEAQRPFDLVRDRLMRATLLRLSSEEHVLLLAMHHAISDGWSMGLLIRELIALYAAFTSGRPSPLPELPIQYADFAVWQRGWLQGDLLEEQVAYWKRQLEGAPTILELPADRPRPAVQTFKGATESFSLPERLAAALQKLGLEAGTTRFVILLAAFNTLLYRYTGQDDILIGTPSANRNRTEIERLIGFFVNTLVLRTSMAGDPTFRELAGRVHEAALGAYAHPDLPFEILVEKLQPERDLSRSPFFQVMFVLTVPMQPVEIPGLTVSLLEIESGKAQFDLTLFISEVGQRLVGSLEYNSDLFDRATIARLAGHYQRLLEGIAADSERRISDLPLLSEAERHQLLVEWNATAASSQPSAFSLQELFEAQVARTPEAIAAACDELYITYRHLDRCADRLAATLLAQGVGAEVLVALLAERGIAFLTAMLAVFKAGGAYLPLDPRYPAQRLSRVLQQCASPLVLCDDAFEPVLAEALEGLPPGAHPRLLRLDQALRAEPPATRAPAPAAPAQLAYVIYTSGSTGIPKGAMLEQRGMLNHLYAKIRDLQLTAADRVAQTAPQSFDISVWQFLAPLLVGGYVQIFRDETAFDPARLLAQLSSRQVTVLETVPSLLRAMSEALAQAGAGRYALPSLRWLIPTGEALPPDLARQWLSYYPNTALLNAYGPTECSDDVAHYRLSEPPAAQTPRIPIGHPVANMQLYVLDAHLRPVPVGVAGELYVGGVGVGRGYLHEPIKTALSFVPNPFQKDEGRGMKDESDAFIPHPSSFRLYKTGDLACWRADGNLDFLGRIDHQVKVRGFRIELGEIEAVLRQHAQVREAVVLAREDTPGEKRLVAYIVTSDELQVTSAADLSLVTHNSSLAAELRDHLRDRLPEFMVPAAFVLLDALPLSSSGKIDRKALPAPDAARPELGTAYLPPRSEAERIITDIWREALHVEQVGVHDNFFDLGGHSLLMMQVQSRLRTAFGKEVSLTDLFKYTTVASLAHYFAEAEPGADSRQADVTRRRAAQRPQSAEAQAIAIIGMVGRFPGAENLEQFWNNLCAGVESITFFEDEQLVAAGIDPGVLSHPGYVKASASVPDIDRFDAQFFGINPREAEIMDPQQRIFLEYAWSALERAGYDPQRYGGRIGVYAGQTVSTYLLNNLVPNQGQADASSAFQVMLNNNIDHLATRTAYRLNLKGPAFSVQTACSTSLVAVHLACQGLINGEADIALAGGVSLKVPQSAGYMYEEGGILSPDGHCRPFDAAAQGTIGGSGLGIVVLKRLAEALEDGDTIQAVIKGSAINNDGARKIGYMAPSEDGQVEAIRDALELSGLAPETIGYIEAHGTGTALGDPIEVAALTRVFRASTPAQGFCAIGSVKGNIGHLDVAAGIAGLIKAALALEHKQLPPSINFTAPNPAIDFAHSPFYVTTELQAWRTAGGQPRRAGVSSFGIGGTNAHVVLEEAPQSDKMTRGQADKVTGSEEVTLSPGHLVTPLPSLLVLSAKTPSALEAATDNLAAHLAAHPEQSLADVAYTLQVGRRHFAHRRMLVCADALDAAAALEARDPHRVLAASEPAQHRSLVFMFPGQGVQYVNMGRGLYQHEPIFREWVDRCAELLMPHLGIDLREVLYPPTTDDRRPTTDERDGGRWPVVGRRLDQTQYAQPALFVIEYALAKLWMSWGIIPKALIGHSLGEYAAACLAGVFSLEDALALVALRGKLMQQLAPGAMLSVSAPPAAVEPLLGPALSLAAINGPELCVISGSPAAIAELAATLAERSLEHRHLHIDVAGHSPLIEPIREAFTAFVATLRLQPPQIPYISNVTGTWISAAEATDPDYWGRHLRQTVRFAEGLQVLLAGENPLLLEVGPGRTLSTFARQQASAAFSSLRHPRDQQADLPFLLTTLGRLWLSGLDIDWGGFYAHERRRRVPLPTYPFARERYWIDPQPLNSGAPRSLSKAPNPADWLYMPYWKPDIAPVSTAEPATWVIFGDDQGAGGELAARLRAEGHTIYQVRPGGHFDADTPAFTIAPHEPQHYIGLLAALESAPQHIVYCAGETFDVYGLLFLSQALGHYGRTCVQLNVITHGAQQVFDNEIVDPARAMILGMALVVPQEYTDLLCRCIDLPMPSQGRQAPHLYDMLLAELTSAPTDPIVAYRGARRWVQTFEQIKPAARAPELLREGGVYLITGGLGRIGRTLARHLAETLGARLVLTSRSPLPPREEWAQRLATPDPADPNDERIRFVRDLEAQGAEVLALAADVADPAQMRAALAQTYQRFGTLHGVIHAAGFLDSDAVGSLREISRSGCEALFRPKVQGLLTLAEVLDDLALDFCVLFSSLTAVLGGPGFAADAAANRFMDAFAQRRSLSQATPWLSVNWDRWQFAADGAPGDGAHAMEQALLPEEGARVLRQVLRLGRLPQVIVSTAHLPTRFDRWLKQRAPAADAQGSAAVAASHARPLVQTSYVAPRNPIEQEVAAVWRQLLGIAEVGIYDDFFELGGHSLLATQVVSRIRNLFGVQLPIRRLLESPTVADLALAIAEEQAGEAQEQGQTPQQRRAEPEIPAPVPVPRDAELQLSFAQQRLWFIDQWEPGNTVYNVFTAVRLSGQLDAGVFERSLAEVVRRHESLRTTFAAVGGRPVQIIAPAVATHASPGMPVVDLRALPSERREAEARRLALEEAQRPFDLARGPLLRVALLQLGGADYILLVNMHHIISDGWSVGVFIQEMATLYLAFSAGQPSPLPALPIQYADFAAWQRGWLQGAVLEQQMTYWAERLGGAPAALDLPTDRPRPAAQTFRGATQVFQLSAQLTDALRALGRAEESTLFMTLLAAFDVLLHRYSGQADILVGTPIANRRWVELEGLIGFFVNTLVLRTDLSETPTFQGLLRQVRETTMGAYVHQDLPFELLMGELDVERDLSRTPLFQVMFVLQNTPTTPTRLPDLTLSPLSVDAGTAMFDLTLEMVEVADGLSGQLEHNTDLFDTSTIARMTEHFQTLLAGIVADPTRPLWALPLLTEAERRQLLVEWNAPAFSLQPSAFSLQELFAAQAARTPDAIALVFDATNDHRPPTTEADSAFSLQPSAFSLQMTYAELNRRANQLAHYLRARGVGPEILVGVCLRRSVEMLIALLGVLKAGGAYLPLDPAYPPERLAFMLEDSGAAMLIATTDDRRPTTDEDAERSVVGGPWSVVETVDLARDWPAIASMPAHNLDSGAAPDNLAYVIYTSGSTGVPKGAAVSHRALINHNAAIARHFALTPRDRVLQFASLSFDVAAEEIFPTWLSGAALVAQYTPLAASFADFSKMIAQHGITALNLPAPYWHEWVTALDQTQAALPRSLRLVVVGSDRVLAEKFTAWRQGAGKSVRWLNAYGATEATITTTIYEPAEVTSRESLPIGRPIASAQVYLLDAQLQPVPVGVAGQLFIGGASLARGYLHRPELTAERFVPNPFLKDEGGGMKDESDSFFLHPSSFRLYKTGDRARFRADGALEFLGRIDQQVKLRGYRVEPSEVEAALHAHQALSAAVVLAREERPGDVRLVAYIVTSDELRVRSVADSSLAAELRSYLAERLPEYMIPAAFVLLDELPLTPSGKLDRKALPQLERARIERGAAFVAPRTPLEQVLAEVWAEVLGLEQVGVEDNFFALGGHSLLATQVLAQLNELFQTEIPLRLLFEATTVARLAEALLREAGERARIERIAELLLKVADLPDEAAQQLSEVHIDG